MVSSILYFSLLLTLVYVSSYSPPLSPRGSFQPRLKTTLHSKVRPLGSQELLFYPRKYTGDEPQTNHCVHFTLSSSILGQDGLQYSKVEDGVRAVLRRNRILRCNVNQTGGIERIDLMKMVREGDEVYQFVETMGASDTENLDLQRNVFKIERPFSSSEFQNLLDCPTSPSSGSPLSDLWSLHVFQDGGMVWSFNHAASDQGTWAKFVASAFVDGYTGGGRGEGEGGEGEMRRSLEEGFYQRPKPDDGKDNGINQGVNILEGGGGIGNTVKYVQSKAFEGFKDVRLDPASGSSVSSSRSSQIFSERLTEKETKKIREFARENRVTVSHVVTAAAHCSYDRIARRESMDYGVTKTVFSLDLGRFQERETGGGGLGCRAGSMDVYLELGKKGIKDVGGVAREVKRQVDEFVSNGFVREAVKVWDFATTVADVSNLVTMKAEGEDMGRGYTLSISNAGVMEEEGIDDVWFAAGQARTGAVNCISTSTVNGRMTITGHGVEEGKEVEMGAVETLRRIGRGEEPLECDDFVNLNLLDALPVASAAYGVYSILGHLPAWSSFFSSINQMSANSTPEDFKAALNFWIFFAAAHPILQPVLGISELMHGTPGYRVGGLVPVLFILLNIVGILVITTFSEVSLALNILVASAFINYVGSGLDGTNGMGDFNLQVNDPYGGKEFRGCPTYEQVRQPSMDGFDVKKYNGLWYEHAFHDWTQFKEVYDTTLDIKVDEDGLGWKDDFGLRGPSPKTNPLSWDKSPVANGAHYFLFGRVDPEDPPGVLREKGFGVEFPNYIVDVQKDENGEYKEAIQFQCLERGEVRVFEGINFMSKNEVMTEEEMKAMHERATKAGMDPYGSSPEQMHNVRRRLKAEGDVNDGSWQAMWKAIGFDKLLELLTESIEDGGR